MQDINLIETTYAKNKKFKKTIFIEGLPGIGFVGKIAADYLVKEFKAKKMADIYSNFFPPNVIMQKNGQLRNLKNKIYHIKIKNKDILILVGDVQPQNSKDMYIYSNKIVEYLIEKKCEFIYTLGGYGKGKIIKKPKIFGCATHKVLVKQYEKFGIIFGKTKGTIIGVAGLIPTLARFKGIKGICIMGETHGEIIDAKSAKEILKVLSKIFEIKFNYKKINERVKKTEKIIKKIETEVIREIEKRNKHPEFPHNSYF